MPNSYKHRSGDRKEGRLLRSLPASRKFIPYSQPDRDGASFFLDEDLDVTEAEKCLKIEQDGGYEGIGFLHFFIAAYIRCLSMLPGMNRFIVGRRIFARNDIDIVLTVKRSTTVEGSETQVKIRFEPTDTIFDVYRKINERIDELKTEDFSSSREDLAEAVANAPRLFVRLGFLVLRILDYFGWLPQNYLDKSLSHASLVISDASLFNSSPVFRQISNFGTLPIYLSIGESQHVFEMERSGLVADTKHIRCLATVDARLAEPHYYAQFLNAMRYIFSHPEILERSPSRVVEDIG